VSFSAESASVYCTASTSGTLFTFITPYPNQGLNPIPTYLCLFYFYPIPKPGFVSPPCYDWCAVGENTGADLSSRGNPLYGEWKNPEIVEQIWQRNVDLFASLFFSLSDIDAPL